MTYYAARGTDVVPRITYVLAQISCAVLKRDGGEGHGVIPLTIVISRGIN